jgi:hypothetical protein
MTVIKDLSAKIDIYDKIIKQKLEYNLELLYNLSMLDAEMDNSVTPSEDNTDTDTVNETPDNTQLVLDNIIVPNPELNNVNAPTVITKIKKTPKNEVLPDPAPGSALPPSVDRVVKKYPNAKRGRPKK